MPLTDDQTAQVRTEIGDATPPSDADLDLIFDRVGTVGGVIYEVTSKRLADLMADPASFSIPGEYSQDTRANIEAYRDILRRFSGSAPVAGGVVEIIEPERRWSR